MYAFLIYIILKLVAYIFWCHLGINKLLVLKILKKVIYVSTLLGIIRLLIGMIFGFLIICILADLMYTKYSLNKWLTYLLCYVPTRIFEWYIIYILIKSINLKIPFINNISNANLTSNDLKSNMISQGTSNHKFKHVCYWILGGTLISCLADLPIVLSLGILPINRLHLPVA